MRRFERVTSVGGFTLMEILMVLVVAAIVAVIVLPRMENDPLLVATQAEQLAGDIRYVQSLSMSQGQRYLLRVLSSTTYELEVKGGAQIPHPTGVPSPITLGSAVTMSAVPTTASCPSGCIGFDGQGIPYSDLTVSTALASAATITLTGNSTIRIITVSPETGRVLVQ
jgi:prepilin-type N-terminal cleavage/methylation domain-containing protein